MRWRVADNLTEKASIDAGTGWGSLPLWMIVDDLREGTLTRLPVAVFAAGGETSVGTSFARPANRPLSPAGTVFHDALLHQLRMTG